MTAKTILLLALALTGLVVGLAPAAVAHEGYCTTVTGCQEVSNVLDDCEVYVGRGPARCYL